MVHEIKAKLKILVIKQFQVGNGPDVCFYYKQYEYVFSYENMFHAA
jgi:hypothetical protein